MRAEGARFFEAMYEKAYGKVINHNRPPDPWNHHDVEFFMSRLMDEMEELQAAVNDDDITGAMDECVDVANFAMFIYTKLRLHQPAIERTER